MKIFKILTLFTLIMVIVIISLTACARVNQNREDWILTADFHAEETSEMLYAKALKEDTLVIYSTSSRILASKKSFEAAYPKLTVQVMDVRFHDILTSMEEFCKTGEPFCDVILSSDSDGSFTSQYLKEGLLHKYIPYDMIHSIKPENNTDLLLFQDEIIQLFYNSRFYSECPVSNWWQLTEPAYKDSIYISNPLRSVTTMTFLLAVIENHELLLASYLDLYGMPLEVPAGYTAGDVFLQKLFSNGIKIVDSSDDVSTLISNSTEENPALGIMISSKLRLSALGYDIMAAYEIEPFCGAYTPNAIMVSNEAPNINSAKLFIRWILGEANGEGEGLKPYLQPGAWSCRNDVTNLNTPDLDSLKLLYPNQKYILENKSKFIARWKTLQDEYGKGYAQ